MMYKNSVRKRIGFYLGIASFGLGLLGGCAGSDSSEYEAKMEELMVNNANTISSRVGSPAVTQQNQAMQVKAQSGSAKSKTIISSTTTSYPWTPYNNMYYQGTPDQQMYACVAQINELMASGSLNTVYAAQLSGTDMYQSLLSTFYQCVMSASQNYNPVSTYMYRNLVGSGSYYGGTPYSYGQNAWQYNQGWNLTPYSGNSQIPYSFSNYTQYSSYYPYQSQYAPSVYNGFLGQGIVPTSGIPYGY